MQYFVELLQADSEGWVEGSVPIQMGLIPALVCHQGAVWDLQGLLS